MLTYPNFPAAIADARARLKKYSQVVHTDHWQGTNIKSKPEMATHELLHHSFCVDMNSMMYNPQGQLRGNFVGILQEDVGANLPWAEDHFQERVCGLPINPGKEWKNWPYGLSAAKFLDERGKFNHNYMERYWPKLAGLPKAPTLDVADFNKKFYDEQHATPDMIMPRHDGIMYSYGDLGDVVKQLSFDPLTRQAYLPVWFPEDTGGGTKRAPCTLGYHFIMRRGGLDITYYIRSCDFLRHFRDDIYLTARLVEWVLEQLRTGGNAEVWQDVKPGKFVMHITSLHLFVNDYRQVFGE